MKKILVALTAVFVAFSLAIAVKTNDISSSLAYLSADDIEALAYSNEFAGGHGERHPQAVQCSESRSWFKTGWKIRAGCCYGWEECNLSGCNGEAYSCDGMHYSH